MLMFDDFELHLGRGDVLTALVLLILILVCVAALALADRAADRDHEDSSFRD